MGSETHLELEGPFGIVWCKALILCTRDIKLAFVWGGVVTYPRSRGQWQQTQEEDLGSRSLSFSSWPLSRARFPAQALLPLRPIRTRAAATVTNGRCQLAEY